MFRSKPHSVMLAAVCSAVQLAHAVRRGTCGRNSRVTRAHPRMSYHANLAAAAPHNPGFLTAIFAGFPPGMHKYALDGWSAYPGEPGKIRWPGNWRRGGAAAAGLAWCALYICAGLRRLQPADWHDLRRAGAVLLRAHLALLRRLPHGQSPWSGLRAIQNTVLEYLSRYGIR